LLLYVKDRRNFSEVLKGRSGHYLHIPKSADGLGRVVMGDPSSGKTSIIFQVADQAVDRRECCVFYDPHLQFMPRYFNAERGDVVINPYDLRCPYYDPVAELNLANRDEAWSTALSQGLSIWPDSPHGNTEHGWFFNATSRKLWQRLLAEHQPESPHEMAAWMRNELEILMRVVGTELETMVPRTSPDQRAAVLSTFSMIADALEQLPRKEERRPIWTVREFSKKRTGWVFLTGTLQTRDSLRPLHSLILDQIILQIASMGVRKDLPIVHMILDEAQSLQRLPQLIVLLAELRKFGLTPTIAFQGRSQMQAIWGDNIEAITGMPMTKFFCRTQNEAAAEWVERMIGKVRLLEVKESRPIHRIRNMSGGTYTEQETVKPLVSAAAIQNVPNLTGYMRYGDGGRVVKFKLLNPDEYAKKFGKGTQADAFIPRESGPVVRKEVSADTAAMVARAMMRRDISAPVPAVEVPQPDGKTATVVQD
jgi:hypothetical protein